MSTRLIGFRRPVSRPYRSNRYVLFSYNGKAIKKKESRHGDETGTNEAIEPSKIIDYATLLSWYNENKARESQIRESQYRASAVGERVPAPDYTQKRRELKFLMQ